MALRIERQNHRTTYCSELEIAEKSVNEATFVAPQRCSAVIPVFVYIRHDSYSI